MGFEIHHNGIAQLVEFRTEHLGAGIAQWLERRTRD